MWLRAVIALNPPTCGAGRQTLRIASVPACRPGNLGSWRAAGTAKGCLASMAIISARPAGGRPRAWARGCVCPRHCPSERCWMAELPRRPPPRRSLTHLTLAARPHGPRTRDEPGHRGHGTGGKTLRCPGARAPPPSAPLGARGRARRPGCPAPAAPGPLPLQSRPALDPPGSRGKRGGAGVSPWVKPAG